MSFPIIILFQNCSQFDVVDLSSFDENGGVPSPPPDEENPVVIPPDTSVARGQLLYSQNCAECHGLIDATSVRNRSASQITTAINSVAVMSRLRGTLSTADIQAIANALASGGGVVTDPATGRETYMCQDGSTSLTPLIKLSNREYRNSVTALLNDFSTSLINDSELTNLLNAVPSDIIIQNRDTLKEQGRLITQSGFNANFEVAWRAATLVSTSSGINAYANTNGCLANMNIDQTCYTSFLREFATRAFRRPVNTTEAQALSTQLWDNSLTKAQQIQFGVTALLQMPDFYYKVYDRGAPIQNGSTTLNITNHELASKLSFFITGFPPDQTLRDLAVSGAIANPTTLRQQVDRLLAMPSSQETIRRLFRESYGYNVYDTFTHSTGYLNGLNPNGLTAAMTSELDTFFVNEVLNRNSTFSGLFTSRTTSISNTSLATIYGVNPGTNITLPTERAGFVNRAAALSKRSGLRTSPIKRGLAVLEHVLCVEVGAPPPSAPTSLPPFEGQVLTTRQATALISETAGTTCVGCHSRMNPLGYAFESFDTLGRYRSQESIYNNMGNVTQMLPINTATTTNELGRRTVNVTQSANLSSELGNSDKAMMCFAKHLKAFESRVNVVAEDNCQMNDVLTALYGTNGNQGTITDAIRSLVLSPSFRRWRY